MAHAMRKAKEEAVAAGQKFKAPDLMKIIAAEWRSLSEQEREVCFPLSARFLGFMLRLL